MCSIWKALVLYLEEQTLYSHGEDMLASFGEQQWMVHEKSCNWRKVIQYVFVFFVHKQQVLNFSHSIVGGLEKHLLWRYPLTI